MAADELSIFRILNQYLGDGARFSRELIHDFPKLFLADHLDAIVEVLPHGCLIILIFPADFLAIALFEFRNELVHDIEGEQLGLFSDGDLVEEDPERGLVVGAVVENAPFVQHLEQLDEPLLVVQLLLLLLLLLLGEIKVWEGE